MSLRNSLVIVLYTLSALELAVLADDPAAALPQSSQDKSVLLFRSGRTVEGQISETETHYVVRRPVGKVEVPKSEIEFAGEDLEAVYRYKRRGINEQDAEGQIRFAQWCLLINLREHAIEHLERAIQLAPQSARAREMLDTIQRTLRAIEKNAASAAAAKPQSEIEPSPRVQAAYQHEVPAALVSSFSVQVQPMLTRTCATAGCHDLSHTGPLILQRSSRPVAKLTQQNLRSVLAQVDFDEPDASPLLAYSVRPHGKSGSFPIPKGVSDPAYGTLADWVRGVSGRSSAKVTESDGGVARARAEAPSRASSGTPNASKPPTPDPAGSTLEREIGQVRAKLDDLTGAGRVYSNKPIAPTPSRIRAGMVQPAAPVPAAAPPATPEPQPPAPVRSSSTSVPTNSEPNKSQESRTQNSTATPASQTTPKMSPPVTAATGPFQPVDPFDPEIFNRQFAPRMK